MAKRKRRAFTREFKAEAVRLVRESGKSVPNARARTSGRTSGQGASLLVELDERAHDRRPFRLIVKAAASFRRSIASAATPAAASASRSATRARPSSS